MTTSDMDRVYCYPTSVTVEGDETVIRMKTCPPETLSGTGKMEVLCTSNGWVKTEHLCPRTGKQLTVNVFAGVRA
jgi:hypothetical protein